MIRGLSTYPQDRLREMEMFSLEKRRYHGDLRAPSTILKGLQETGEGLLTRARSVIGQEKMA